MKRPILTKVWVTEYCLWKGEIFQMDPIDRCTHMEEDIPTGVLDCSCARYNGFYYKHPKNAWHTDKDKALERAEEMRQKKIEELSAEIDRLKNLQFQIAVEENLE